MTPGDILTTDARVVCVPGYASSVRHVTTKTKEAIYAAYGIGAHKPGMYEVDHLVSLQLGGSNAPSNLWPQSYTSLLYNAKHKDRLEGRLHRLVCSGLMGLTEAQRLISTDWIFAYKTYVEN